MKAKKPCTHVSPHIPGVYAQNNKRSTYHAFIQASYFGKLFTGQKWARVRAWVAVTAKGDVKTGHSAYFVVTTKEDRDKWRLKYRFGLTPDKRKEMSESQGNLCAICGRKKDLVVDHKHTPGDPRRRANGKVRGLLCQPCNHTVGMLETIGLERFVSYLEKYKNL